jgi:phage minor structural protein
MTALIVKTLSGEEAPLTGFYEFHRKLAINGDYLITFSIDRNERNATQFDQLVNKNKIVLDDDTFIIDDMERDPDNDAVTKEISARHEMFDRLYAHWVDEQYTAQKPLQDWMDIVLAETGLTVQISGDFPSEQYENFGNDNALNLFKNLIDRFQVEYRVYGTRIVIAKRIGVQRDAQFRHGHNLKTFSDEFNTDNLVTQVTAKGKNDDDGNPIVSVTVKSPNWDKFERIYAMTVQDERFTVLDSLRTFAESQFNEGEYSAKVEVEELIKNGLKLHEYEVGDSVWCIYDKDGMNLDFSVRIINQDDNPFDKSVSPVVELGSAQKSITTSIASGFNQIREAVKQANQTANVAIVQANGKNKTFYSTDEPSGDLLEGDLWFEIVNGQFTKMHRYDGTMWQLIVSQDANDALNKAIDALESANGKNTVYHQAAQPIAANNQDIWFRENADNTVTIFVYQDGQWVNPIQDGVKAAQDQADAAVATADAATNRVNQLDASVTAAQQTAADAASQASSAWNKSQDAWNEALTKADADSVYTKTEMDTALDAKASTTTVNTLTGRVDSAETNIQQNTNAITQKASQSSVNALTGRVSTAEATLTTQANQIAARITSQDADAKYATQTALTATSSSLTSQISSVQTDLDNIQIGARNRIPRSDFASGWNTNDPNYQNAGLFNCSDGSIAANTPNGFIGNGTPKNDGTKALARIYYHGADITPFEYDNNYIFRTYGANFVNCRCYLTINIWGPNWTDLPDWSQGEGVTSFLSGQTTVSVIRYTLTVEAIDQSKPFSFSVPRIKAEIGTKSSDWSPAPEDMATAVQFTSLSQTLTGFQTTVQQDYATKSLVTQTATSLQSSIDGKVGADVYNSKISQLANDINLRVKKGDTVTQLNIDGASGTVLIDGKLTHITGQTTIDEAVITHAMIASIDLGKATFGELNGNKIVAHSMTADRFDVVELSAIAQNVGVLTGGTINGVSINGANIYQSNGSQQTWLNNSGLHSKSGDLDIYMDANGLNITKANVEKFHVNAAGNVEMNGANLFDAISLQLDDAGFLSWHTQGARLGKGPGTSGLGQENYLNIRSWDGFSISPSSPGFPVPQHNPAFSVDTRKGDAYIHSNLFIKSWGDTGVPQVSLAIGDNDTGLNDTGDGSFDLTANGNPALSVRPDRTINVHNTLNVEGDTMLGGQWEGFGWRDGSGGYNAHRIELANDAAGLGQENNINIRTWNGFSISASISGMTVPQNNPAFSVDARNGIAYVHGDMFVRSKGDNGAPAVTLAIGDSDTGINWSGDGHIDIVTNGEWQIGVSNGIVVNHSLNVWGDAWANNWYTNSLASLKTDIVAIEDDIALSLVNSIDIYKYRYKKEAEKGIEVIHYGPIIGDGYNTPAAFLNAEGNAVDDHSSIFLAIKAFQKLTKLHQQDVLKIANLESTVATQQQQINDLVQQNNDLRNRVQLLEAA